MVIDYTPTGICASHIRIEIDGDIVQSVEFTNGCPGNHKGLNALVRGMAIDDVIERLSGITCHTKPTSCPDQLAQALIQYKASLRA